MEVIWHPGLIKEQSLQTIWKTTLNIIIFPKKMKCQTKGSDPTSLKLNVRTINLFIFNLCEIQVSVKDLT